MPADFSEPLARSTSAGSPPAIRYRAPPMVRNRVATAAMIPVIQVVMLPMTVGRSATANGVGAGAGRGSLAPSQVREGWGEHGRLGRPAPEPFWRRGEPHRTGHHGTAGRWRFLAHQGLQLGAQRSTRVAGGTQLAPN